VGPATGTRRRMIPWRLQLRGAVPERADQLSSFGWRMITMSRFRRDRRDAERHNSRHVFRGVFILHTGGKAGH
jgi:hypothetical protein